MKYDSSIVELKNLLPNPKSVLIAIPANADTDRLASALALFLTLESQGKSVSVVCDDDIKVASGNLFGVDHIQKALPSTDGGNLTLTLEGVAASDNTIPALEKLDWYAENNNLNLVFHVLPGQTFQPAKIVPHYQGSGFNLIFVLGAASLNALGNLYQQNQAAFSGAHIVNIDNQSTNTSFGQTNVLDTIASSVCEIMVNLILDLGYPLDQDAASNLLAGIFVATDNLTNSKASPDTFMAVANCLRVGGRKPNVAATSSSVVSQPQPQTPAYDWSALMPPSVANESKRESAQPVVSTQQPSDASYTVPSVVSSQPQQNYVDVGDHSTMNPLDAIFPPSSSDLSSASNTPSPEEKPAGEGVVSETVEPEWLTPKIFKGSSIG